jgi:hypothetical protein
MKAGQGKIQAARVPTRYRVEVGTVHNEYLRVKLGQRVRLLPHPRLEAGAPL